MRVIYLLAEGFWFLVFQTLKGVDWILDRRPQNRRDLNLQRFRSTKR